MLCVFPAGVVCACCWFCGGGVLMSSFVVLVGFVVDVVVCVRFCP